MKSITQSLLDKKAVSGKLISGAVLAVAMVLFSAGMASAMHDKPSKEDCAQNGYKNYGQCVSNFARGNGNGGGNGYGGGNTTINVGGDLIVVIINYFF